MLSVTLLAALLALCTGQIVSKGSCPDNLKVVEDFSVEKYLGKWFEYAKYPVSFEADGRCITAEYSLGENGEVSVKNALINDKTNALEDILGTAALVSSGKLLVKFPVSPDLTVSSNYWVLDTDYENYTVIYSCTPMTKYAHATVVWILTREQLPEPEVVEKAVAVLKNNDISLQKLEVTNQISCN